MSEHVQAYHFVGPTLLDGRPVPPDGEWLVHDGEVVLCASGLHASRRPWHALLNAPGAPVQGAPDDILCLVELDGIVAEGAEKLVARCRRIIRRVDLTADLRSFARACARDVLHLWAAPDVVRRYLETGDESIRDAAREAAASAAWAAEWDPELNVTRDAARAAESAASWAARDAARYASNDAAWASAWASANEVSWKYAWATASAVWAAARAAQGARFDALCRARLDSEND